MDASPGPRSSIHAAGADPDTSSTWQPFDACPTCQPFKGTFGFSSQECAAANACASSQIKREIYVPIFCPSQDEQVQLEVLRQGGEEEECKCFLREEPFLALAIPITDGRRGIREAVVETRYVVVDRLKIPLAKRPEFPRH